MLFQASTEISLGLQLVFEDFESVLIFLNRFVRFGERWLIWLKPGATLLRMDCLFKIVER